MPTGRKPPIMPPRNPLKTATDGIGRRAPLGYGEALRRHREKVRMQKAVTPKAKAAGGPLGVLLPNNDPRRAARQLLVGVNDRAAQKAKRKAEEAQRHMAEEMRLAGFAGDMLALIAARDPPPEEAPSEDPPTNRPPRREAGRYDGLKDAGREPG